MRSSDPWDRLKRGFHDLGEVGAQMARARARLHNGVLTLEMPAGRWLAEAKKVLARPAVLARVREYFPANTTVVALPLPGTGSKREQADALKRQVLDDPDVKRVLGVLGGEIQGVTPKE